MLEPDTSSGFLHRALGLHCDMQLCQQVYSMSTREACLSLATQELNQDFFFYSQDAWEPDLRDLEPYAPEVRFTV